MFLHNQIRLDQQQALSTSLLQGYIPVLYCSGCIRSRGKVSVNLATQCHPGGSLNATAIVLLRVLAFCPALLGAIAGLYILNIYLRYHFYHS